MCPDPGLGFHLICVSPPPQLLQTSSTAAAAPHRRCYTAAALVGLLLCEEATTTATGAFTLRLKMSTSRSEFLEIQVGFTSSPEDQGPNSSSPDSPAETSSEKNDEVSQPMDEDGLGTKRRSAVWEHFFRITKEGGEVKARCKYCKKELQGASGSGTTHLKNHYERQHKKGSMRQQVLTNNFNKKSPELTSYTFDPVNSRKELATAIILHEWPLSIVDSVGFKRYSTSLQPMFKVPCRNTIKSEIFKIYEYQKEKTLNLVESNASRLAITTDMWTASTQKKGFMAVTAHFIDAKWTLQSYILRFIYVPCPHTKDVLCDVLMDCLMDWNIDTKVSCITVDNCSTNDVMVNLLLCKLDSDSLLLGGDLIHMRCCAHILNLVVKDGLDVIKDGVEKIRDSVGYWTATPKRQEKFEETSRQLRISSTKKLGLDCATRWNSTFLMLDTALVYKDVFNRLKTREVQFTCAPDDEEWKFAKEVCEKLKLFYEVTEVFSGTKYPTANLCFTKICEIRIELRGWISSNSNVISEMASKMIIKFDKYWAVIHGVVGVATVLDPRLKIQVLEFYFDDLYGESAPEEIEKVRKVCYKLLSEYQGRLECGTEVVSESSSYPNVSNTSSNKLSRWEKFVSRKKSRKENVTTELDHYLEEDIVAENNKGFDVLTWWKINAVKYPTLQAMARDMLAIPVSTVASESAFSTSGRLVSPHRSRFNPKTLEALMCAQSWLWEKEMKGESTEGYATIYDDVDTDGNEEFCVTI